MGACSRVSSQGVSLQCVAGAGGNPEYVPNHYKANFQSFHYNCRAPVVFLGFICMYVCSYRVIYQLFGYYRIPDMQFSAISVRITALVGRMQIDSTLPTTPFGLLVDIDSNHLPLASDSSKTIRRSTCGGSG